MNFADRLIEKIKKTAPICMGLDPRYKDLPRSITQKAPSPGTAFFEFNKAIIDAVYDLIPAVKIQMAFYEMFGLDGMAAFSRTIEYAKSKQLIVIADGKRNDIDSSAAAYAKAYLDSTGDFSVDALTVSPYLGYDSLKPFIENCKKHDKGIFILVKTSNKSSGDLQDRMVEQEKIRLFELMGQYVDSWGQDLIGKEGYSSVGAVVGATFPAEAKSLRGIMPNTFFLVPGYGAQGAGAKEVRECFDAKGKGAIISSSRGIIFAYQKLPGFDERNFAEASRKAVENMKKSLESVL